ncbi:MAG: hypothetical protein LBL54_01030, partial [Clostridiales Family XIII bacterium]|nr:hypothetical protein [Clostridiales Family XIII bacterium]
MNVHRTRKSVVAIAVALCICVALIVVYSTSNNHNVVSAADEVKMHLENINEMLEGGSDSTLPLQSSNPYDYIADNEDFQRIIELGDSALPELERTLSDSPDNGLNEYIIAIAIQEISGTDVDSFNNRTDIKWENAKQFLEEWTSAKDDAKTVRRSDEPLDIQRDIVIEYALTPEDEEWANKTPEELRAIINIP